MIYLDTFENRKKELLNEKLDKIADHVVYTGETAEVGGNVAFESIEQLGSMVEAPAEFKSGQGSYPSYTVLKGITEVVDKGGWVISQSLPYDLEEGTCVYTTDFVMYVMKVNGVKYIADSNNKTIKLKGNIIYTPDPNDNCSFTPGGTEFKPFFTEEQYQALLDLIG